MTFIPKPKKFKPFNPRFWDREFRSEFNKWEFQLLEEFNSSKKAERPVISGTALADHRLGRGRFLLIPSRYLTQDYILCECPSDIPIPSSWTYVTIHGRRKIFQNHYEILVDDIVYTKMKTPLKPEIDFREFQDYLLLKWNGIDSPLRELLAFEFVSSPPLFALKQAGGLSLSIYDGASTGQSKKILRYFRNIIPPQVALGKSGLIDIPWMHTKLTLPPFSWSFRSFDADKPISQPLYAFLSNRKSNKFAEISIGLGSKESAPISVYEPPLVMVDQPTLLPSSAEERSINLDPPPEVTKYIIDAQMNFPTIGTTQVDLEKELESVSSKIVELAAKYNVPSLVQRHGLFDSSYYGRPQSIMRLALASARAYGKQSIDDQWVKKAFNEYYLKNIKTIFDSWPDVFTSKGVEIVTLKENLDKQILRFITDNETKDFGVGIHLIEEHFNRDKIELIASLRRLLALGKIRETKLDVYRSVPLE